MAFPGMVNSLSSALKVPHRQSRPTDVSVMTSFMSLGASFRVLVTAWLSSTNAERECGAVAVMADIQIHVGNKMMSNNADATNALVMMLPTHVNIRCYRHV